MKFLPFLMKERAIQGIKIASMLSPMFSIIAEWPSSTAISIYRLMFLDPNLKLLSLLSFSFSLIHPMPWSWGSIIKGYLSLLVNIVPFSTETLSEGRVCLFHLATVDSSVRSLIGSLPALVSILFCLKYFSKSSFIIFSLKLLLKGPAYEINDEAKSTSPTITLMFPSRTTIDWAQRSFSLPKAAISRWAKFKRRAHLSA